MVIPDKINTLLLCDIVDHLGIETELDTGFIRAAVHGGHGWALDQKYGYDSSESNERRAPVVAKVHDVFRLWTVLESAYEGFTDDEKAEVLRIEPTFGKNVRWPGFDGNNEGEYMAVAAFMIEHMNFYTDFKGREHLNSHMPTLETFERMWAVFEPIHSADYSRRLSPEDVGNILAAKVHPSRR